MNKIAGYNSAVNYISKSLREYLHSIPDEIKEQTQEIRLRSEKPLMIYGTFGTYFLNKNSGFSINTENAVITKHNDVTDTFNRICSYSIYSFQSCINSGYIPMENGNRAGICGTAVIENGAISSVRDISSINIRISQEIKGCSNEILSHISDFNESIIIAGPPSSGKTTIIRDIARVVSSGMNGRFLKTVLIDERREISGTIGGIATNDVGISTDVLDSYPKHDAIDIAVRTLSPEVIICDEISTEDEIKAITSGINCGVRFIVTVHAGSEEELLNRNQIERLLLTYSFKKLFLIGTGQNIGKTKKIYDTRELLNEISLRRIGCH